MGNLFKSVLLAIDESPILQAVRGQLQRDEILTKVALSRSDLLKFRDDFDLLVIGPAFASEDLVELLCDVRSESDRPVLFIGPDSPADLAIEALELGADDFMTWPMDPRELKARMHAVWRRCENFPMSEVKKSNSGKWSFAGWELRLKARELRDPSGSIVSLTKGEYALLVAFVEAAQRPLSREELLKATRIHEDIHDRSIDVQILRLRRKLDQCTTGPNMIKTRRGLGYVFDVPTRRE